MDIQIKKLEERLNVLVKKEKFKTSELVIDVIDNSKRADDPENKLLHVCQRATVKFGTGKTEFVDVDEWIPRE